MGNPVYLNAMRAFEASARHQSFSAAAAELNVTPAAVGQLVRGLEEWLGAALFHRSPGGRSRQVPTELAERALPEIRAGFERLILGLGRLKEGAADRVLTVTASPAFASKWLLPRIERFHAAWPDTDLRLDTSLKLLDFAAQGIDVGVRYGAGSWPGLVAEKLLDEEIYPVCSPALLRRHPVRSPVDLATQTLIHDVSVDRQAGFVSWESWFEQVAHLEVHKRRGLRINNSAAVLQAAFEGHGVALARSVMAREDVAAGRLVRLFPDIVFPSPMAYYIVHRPECAGLPRLVEFCNWLRAEAGLPVGMRPAKARVAREASLA